MTKAESSWAITDVNFWLDGLLLVAFIVFAAVTLVIRFVFPPVTSSEGWLLWDRTLDDWIQYQFFALAVFTILVVIHVMLHWNWVCNVYVQRVRKKRKERPSDGIKTIVGVGLLISLLTLTGLFIAIASLMIHHP